MNYKKFKTHKWTCWVSVLLLMANPVIYAETVQQYDSSPTGTYIPVQTVKPGENPVAKELFYDPRIQLKTPLSPADSSDDTLVASVSLSSSEKVQVAALYEQMAANIMTASDVQLNVIRQAEAVYRKVMADKLVHEQKLRAEQVARDQKTYTDLSSDSGIPREIKNTNSDSQGHKLSDWEKKYTGSGSLPADIPRLNPHARERETAPPILRFFYELSDSPSVTREIKQSKEMADLFQIDTPTFKDFPSLVGRFIKNWFMDFTQRVDDKSIKDLLAENKDFFTLSDEQMMQSLFSGGNDPSQKFDGQKGIVVDSVNWSLPIVATYVLTNPPKHMIPWLRIICWWRLVKPQMMRDYVKASAKLAEFRRKVAQGEGFKIRYIPYDEYSRQASKNFGNFFRKLMPDEIGCVQLVMSGQKKE